jgi:hypothetical protein
MRFQPCFVHRDAAFTSPIRALHSLTEAQAWTLTRALEGLSGDWKVERQESYDGNLCLVLLPELNHSDLTLAVNRDGAGLHLSVLHEDTYTAHGAFDEVAELVEAIQVILSDELQPQRIVPTC